MMRDERVIDNWITIVVLFIMIIVQGVFYAMVVTERDDLKVKYEEVKAKYEALDKLLTVKLYPEETE